VLTLAYPWLLLALPLPWLVRRWLAPYEESRTAVRIPTLQRLARLTGQRPATGAVVAARTWTQRGLIVFAWFVIILTIARPQWIGTPMTRTVPSRDLLLAVDLSGSMATTDFTDTTGQQVDRLTAVKQVLDDFLTRRAGDRVGLILFGAAAFVQVPFTEDLELCRTLLDEAQVGMAGPQTAVGDAIGLAITVFERSALDEQVLILLTDGNDTGSKVPPERAADIARDKAITVHTVAVGDPEAAGEEQLDEDALKAIATTTGGQFYRAGDRAELEGIYGELDALGTRELEKMTHQPQTDLFHWPLALFLTIGVLYHGGRVLIEHLGAGWRPATSAMAVAVLALFIIGAKEPTVSEISRFHFLRPVWWLASIPVGFVVLAISRRGDPGRAWQGVIAGNLLKHLIVRPGEARRFRPIHGLAVVWGLTLVALAGPTWRRAPAPFAEDEAALVIALEVSPTMLAQDVQPSRLERAVHKIVDLLEDRPGAQTALVAYAGSAHLVMPMTTDADVITTFAAELSPEVMPREGDVLAEALELANAQITRSGTSGSIVVMTDGVADNQTEDLRLRAEAAPIHILAVAGMQDKPLPPGSPPALALDRDALERTARAADATLTVVATDDRDVQQISRRITASFVAAQQTGSRRWLDMGYWLTPLIGLATLMSFRRGWFVQWAAGF
jgi:Mg-chelatase subunit ChlD